MVDDPPPMLQASLSSPAGPSAAATAPVGTLTPQHSSQPGECIVTLQYSHQEFNEYIIASEQRQYNTDLGRCNVRLLWPFLLFLFIMVKVLYLSCVHLSCNHV